MKMHDTRYMMGLIPFQAYVNLPIQTEYLVRAKKNPELH